MPVHSLRSLIKILLSLFFAVATHAFTFTYTPPTQCDPFTISWQGGQAPFEILLVPVFDSPRNFSVPSLPNNSNFTLQLPLSAGQEFLIALSDASGFASGGVSDILTVGASTTGSSCSTQIPPLKFTFSLDSPLQQCAPVTISGYTGAVQPITMTGLVPLGTSVQIPSTSSIGSTSFVWNPANIPAGTSVIFFLADSQGNFGGSSHLIQAVSGTDSCINAQSPHSTTDVPTAVSFTTSQAIGSSSTTLAQSTVTITSGRKISPASIGGIVAGCLVALLILGTLSAFFFRTYLPFKAHHSLGYNADDGPMPLTNYTSRNPLPPYYPPVGVSPSQWTTFSSPAGDGAQHLEDSANAIPVSFRPSAHGYDRPDSLQAKDLAGSARSSKSAVSPYSQRPARFILHTDAEEDIELPPQYPGRLQRPSFPTKSL